MKHLDWKSFAIGILLTSTVIFGAAASRVNRVWDNEQKWMANTYKNGLKSNRENDQQAKRTICRLVAYRN